jgi:diaminohydroxyphosphoribosylaminopyrimidine deaminase/5-amino-6-(5-phosphoribosylamino)uracil reductase
MVGTETAIRDNPSLSCRLPGLEDRSPLRVVVDSRLRLQLTSELVVGAAKIPTIVIAVEGSDRTRRNAFKSAGVEVIETKQDEDGRVDLTSAMQSLGDRGVTRVLVEGGAQLAASLMRAQLVDRLAWFRAPALVGGDGLPVVGSLGVEAIDDVSRWQLIDAARYGVDVLETYERLA